MFKPTLRAAVSTSVRVVPSPSCKPASYLARTRWMLCSTLNPAGSAPNTKAAIATLVGAQLPDDVGPSLFHFGRRIWCLKNALRTFERLANVSRDTLGSRQIRRDRDTQPV